MKRILSELTDILVRDHLKFKGGALLIYYDNSNKDIGAAIYESAYRVFKQYKFKNKHTIQNIEKPKITLRNFDFYRKNGEPIRDFPDNLRHEIRSALSGPDKEHNTLIYIMQGLDGEQPVKKQIIKTAQELGKIGGLADCTIGVLQQAFHPDNNLNFSAELYDFILQEKEVKVTCDRGTNLNITMDHDKYKLVNSNGVLIPERYGNPIPAEVFAHPVDANGTMVISGSYGPLMGYEDFVGNYSLLAETLDKTPITWTFENGKITDVKCENDIIKKFVKNYVFELEPEHGPKIGEFGLPANLHILKLPISGNLLLDEKGRVHIANGDGYQTRTGCEYEINVHGDGLIANATMHSARLNKDFMVNNVYSSELFKTVSQ
ncbi:MAG: hypothetical protein ABH828_06130 [archaeon]